MKRTKMLIFLGVAILLLILHQVFLFQTSHKSPWLLFRPNYAKPNTTVLIMVTSYAEEFVGRRIVRETYLSVPSNRYFLSRFLNLYIRSDRNNNEITQPICRSTYLFVVGQGNITEELQQEQAKYQDIYFLECADGYYNLSDKVRMHL
jgi:hypothetical protein